MMKNIECICDLDELIIEKAPLLLVDTISSNRNFYPKDEVIKAIEFYNKLCDKVDPTYRYMLIRHPKVIDKNEFDNGLRLDISDISYEKVAGWLEKVYYDENDNVVYGDIKILNTKNGLIIRYLYEKGFPIGFSIRLAYTESEESIDENHQKYYIKRGLLINGWDFTLNPSFVFTWIKKDESGINIIKNIKNKEITNKGKVKDIDLFMDEKNIEIELKTKFNLSIEQVKELSHEIYSLVQDIKIENEKINIKNKNNSKEDKMELDKNLEKIVFEKKIELEKMEINKEKLKLEIEKLEQIKSQLEIDINKLKNELDEKHNQIIELNRNLEYKENELMITIDKVNKYKNNIESLDKTIEEKTQELNKIKNLLNEYGEKLKEVESLDKTIEEKTYELNKIKDLLNEYNEKLKEIENLDKIIEEKTQELDKIKDLLNEYNEKLKEIENIINEKQNKYDINYKYNINSSLVIKYKDKEFTLDNPPKIRIVEDKISESEWGKVDKDELRKLLYLTQDEKLIRETFGIVKDIKDYSTYKYPHHELVESEDKNYDFDLILNLNGLRTALIYATGFAEKYLSQEDKEKLGKHLLYHYEYLRDEKVIDEIPASLFKITNQNIENDITLTLKTDYLDEIREDDKIILEKGFDLLKSLIDNKIIVIEGMEDTSNIEVEPELMSKLISVMSKEFIYYLNNTVNYNNMELEQDNINMEDEDNVNEVNEDNLIMYIVEVLRYYYDNNEQGRVMIDELGIDVNDISNLKTFLVNVYTQNDLEIIMMINNLIKEAIIFKTLNEEFIDLDNPMSFIEKVKEANVFTMELYRYFGSKNSQEEEEENTELELQEPSNKKDIKLEPDKDYVILDKQDMPEKRKELLTKGINSDINIDFIKENLINRAIIQILTNRNATEDDVNEFLELIENDIKDKEEFTLEELKNIIDKNLKIIQNKLNQHSNDDEYSLERVEKMERKGKAMVETTLYNTIKQSLFDKLLNE